MKRGRHSLQILLLLVLSLLLQHQPTLAEYTNASSAVAPDINSTDDGDIRGGTPINPLSWYGVFTQSRALCGAALIHGDIALTAAHCLNSVPGGLRFNSNRRSSGGTVVSVVQAQKHPGWTGVITSADLAILVLADFVSLTPVNLNQNGELPTNNGDLMFASGFGLTRTDSTVSEVLLGTTIPYIRDCSNRVTGFDPNRMICGDSKSTATCGGDSGSPIVMDNTRTQVGINSFSDGGCDDQDVDVYTRVSTYYDWITQQICTYSKQPPPSCSPATAPTPGPGPGPSPETDAPTADGDSRPTCVLLPLLEPARSGIQSAIGNMWDRFSRFTLHYGEHDEEEEDP